MDAANSIESGVRHWAGSMAPNVKYFALPTSTHSTNMNWLKRAMQKAFSGLPVDMV